METSFKKSQSSFHKVKNILQRYKSFKEIGYSRGSEHPENLYLLCYFPKYYQNLRLKITNQHSLLSKIKRIKKIKRIISLEWADFGSSLRRNWMILFRNCRKDIEKIPQVPPPITNPQRIKSFWTKHSIQQVRFFFNIQKHFLSIGDSYLGVIRWRNFENPPAQKALFKYFRNTRRLQKRLKILADPYNCTELKNILENLKKRNDYRPILLKLNIDLFENRYTNGDFWLSKLFDTGLGSLSQTCSNLTHLAVYFERFFPESPEFPHFLEDLQNLAKIETLEFSWKKDMVKFLPFIKPAANLRNLKLSFNISDLAKENSLERKDEKLVEHWEHIKELKTLKLSITCSRHQDFHFMRAFVTMILKKVLNLISFKFWLRLGEDFHQNPPLYEPFFVEQVPHLSKTLRIFKAVLCDFADLTTSASVPFDLKMLKPFKNLRKIWVCGVGLSFANIKEAINVLEDVATLNLYGIIPESKDHLRDLLESISKAKKLRKNLKIKLALEFEVPTEEDQMKDLDDFWEVLNSRKQKEGVLLTLTMHLDSDPGFDEISRLMGRYSKIQNCVIHMVWPEGEIIFIKISGRKEPLLRRVL